jgi:hypothetical protein
VKDVNRSPRTPYTGETRNIANDKPAIVERMSKGLDAWTASVNRSKTGADYQK